MSLFWEYSIQFHKFHIVRKSPWPIFISVVILNLLISVVFLFFSKKFTYFTVSFIMSAFLLFVWWRDVSRERNTGHHNYEVRDGLKLGILLFIFREVMFFSAWFWAFFHSSLVPSSEMGTVWPPFSLVRMDPFKVPLLNTCVLLLSGGAVTLAHQEIITNKNASMRILSTIFLGLFFTSLQALEYLEASFNISDNSYGSTFFVTTGFHGLHVIIGSLFLIYCFIFFFNKNLTKWQHTRLEFAIWYWHFVDVVWLFLFFFIYWWSF